MVEVIEDEKVIWIKVKLCTKLPSGPFLEWDNFQSINVFTSLLLLHCNYWDKRGQLVSHSVLLDLWVQLRAIKIRGGHLLNSITPEYKVSDTGCYDSWVQVVYLFAWLQKIVNCWCLCFCTCNLAVSYCNLSVLSKYYFDSKSVKSNLI